jgi:DNA-binding MarR family transcriptional regulator
MKFYGKKLMMNKSNFSNLVEDMIEEGLIKKMENSDDRRQYLLMLTEQGEVFLENCRKSINQKFWEQIKDMDPEELDKLNESFKEIRRIFESI